VRDAGFKHWDVITPVSRPRHGRRDGAGRSMVPIFTFIGGTIGFFTAACS
jgi:hypothetical protein